MGIEATDWSCVIILDRSLDLGKEWQKGLRPALIWVNGAIGPKME